jgi:UDP-N-acetylmuramate--alanine ligase
MTAMPPRPAGATPSEHGGLAGLPAHVHLLGVGGAGVSGLARILRARGVAISGHDRSESGMLDALKELAFPIVHGDSRADHLPAAAELVIRSAAVPADDPQVVAAEARGVPVVKYAEFLPRLASPERLLGVAGTHGKTTTSWMLWHALDGMAAAAGSGTAGALIGGTCRRLATNALAGSPDGFFCLEACEYDRSFLRLEPQGAAITNVDEDHLDYYGTFAAIRAAFARFASQVAPGGLLVLGRGVPEEVEFTARATVWRLGRELETDLLGEERGRFRFRLRGPGWATRPIQLAVPGHFNVENAALALALALGLVSRTQRVAPEALLDGASNGIERFLGAGRRFEPWGSVGGVQVVHDYAHHPAEVRATVEAALRVFPRLPLHVLFQPHQHSRTARFLEEFAESLRAARHVVVAEVYGARKHIDGERFAGATELARALERRGVRAVDGGPLSSATDHFVRALPEKAAALVIGAGDVERVRDALFRDLALRGALRGEPRR